MISILLIIVFVLGYLAIALENTLRLNKAAAALITGVLCWTLYMFSGIHSSNHVETELLVHFGEIASILFFLLGAMTIVELIDSYNGFFLITRRIKTNSTPRLLLTVSLLTFFLSALLDNLTTSIVMTSLCSKIISGKQLRLWFCGMIIIAANAGGVWSPLGDVTTTMLWIGGQITALNIIKQLILPAIAVLIVPLGILMLKFRKQQFVSILQNELQTRESTDSRIMLISGISLLLMVPVFKTLTGLPPVMGMLLALGIIWVITAILKKTEKEGVYPKLSVAEALQRIDAPGILFFLGILLAVAALQSFGMLHDMAGFLSTHLKNDYLIGTSLGLLSAIVDNVPLVAATQGMYNLSTYPTDHSFWEFIALTTGTGGSAIIIGSAAGVAVMGIERVDFMWYLKKISWLALAGFFAGILVFLIMR